MNQLLVTVAAISFLGAIAWLVLVYRLDKHKPEPFPLLTWLFVLGVLCSFPAGFLNTINLELFGMTGTLVLVGIVEEGFKFLACYIGVRKSKFFDEPIDGVVYASVVALGFSFSENIGYLIEPFTGYSQGIWSVSETAFATIVRGSTSFLHVLMSSVWGIAYGYYRLNIISRMRLVGFIGLSAFLHSFYDLGANLVVLPFILIGGAFYFYYKMKHLNRISQFNQAGDIHCPHCSEEIPGNSLHCQCCGEKIVKASLRNVVKKCDSCEVDVSDDWEFCKACGFNISRNT